MNDFFRWHTGNRGVTRSWFPGTVDIQAICLALPRGKRNFMVGFIRPRPIATRRASRDSSVIPVKGVSLCAPWNLHDFLIPCSSLLEKKKTYFLTYLDFSTKTSSLPAWGKSGAQNWQLTCNSHSTRFPAEFTVLSADQEKSLIIFAFLSLKMSEITKTVSSRNTKGTVLLKYLKI